MILSKSTTKLAIATLALITYGMAQAPPAQDNRKFKEGEEALATPINAEKDPQKKLQLLDAWKQKFPESDYAEARLGVYFQTYGELKRWHDQILVAQELRKTHPDDLGLLRAIFEAGRQINPPGSEDLTAMNEAARYIVDHADQIFAPDKMPQGQTAAQWGQLKPQMVAFANAQIDSIAQQRGQDAVIALLKQDPARPQLNVWLGKQILAEAKAHPERQGTAIFHYARAAAYDGPGALPAADRASMKSFVDRAYKTYHGSAEGEDQVLAVAKTNALPPDGFVIKDIVTVAKEKAAAEEEARGKDPMGAQWRDLKAILVADDGPAKFDAEIKNNLVPKFKGKIVSMTPALKPKTIVLAVEKDGVPDCTLTFETALPGKMELGSELIFTGVAKSFTKDPYMLTLGVDKENLEGWTGKNTPAGGGASKGKATKKSF